MKNLKLYLLDMDGTIYLDNNLFDGTLEFLDYVKDIGGRYLFLTNNSSKGVKTYIEKLNSMGIKATSEDFLTSVDVAVDELKQNGFKKIYALGTKSFKKQLSESGLNITEDVEDGIDCLILGYDTELTYKKLEDACILLREDIAYLATNPDWTCPTWFGGAPDCGALAEMLCHASGKMPKFLGKPEPKMLELAMKKTGFNKEQTAIIGDRLYTDIASGVNAGITTIFVLSGDEGMEDLEKYTFRPTYIFENIKEFLKKLK